jgi:uncharacterized flavoprotein (TIGR03862 family)
MKVLNHEEFIEVAVIGGGPAGLRAAEVAVEAGAKVTLFEAMPSVGRKFLVAGRGGLNLTKDEDLEVLASHYSAPEKAFWRELLKQFGPQELKAWAASLGVETFSAKTGRVYPLSMKGAPLLRRWVEKLRGLGVQFALRHRLVEIRKGPEGQADLTLMNPSGARRVKAQAVVMAMGGASWPQTGADGQWTNFFSEQGIAVAPWAAANCGWEVAWSPEFLAVAEGQPLKNLRVQAGAVEAWGELVITRYGLEGGPLYELGPVLRGLDTPRIILDLKPTFTVAQLVAKLGGARRHFLKEGTARWRLSPAAAALLSYATAGEPMLTGEAMARATKACEVSLTRARPLAEAISSAGGLRWTELTGELMLRQLPGFFVAGEMIDWEAPTGGYLLQGCFCTGQKAGQGAATWAHGKKSGERLRDHFPEAFGRVTLKQTPS